VCDAPDGRLQSGQSRRKSSLEGSSVRLPEDREFHDVDVPMEVERKLAGVL